MTRRRLTLLMVIAVLPLPLTARADAWDDEMRAEHAAASTTTAMNTPSPSGMKTDSPPPSPPPSQLPSQLPICEPAIDRCPAFVRSVSSEPQSTVLGLNGPSELQVVVEKRWQAQAVVRRTGGPRAWTPTKTRRTKTRAARR